MDRLWMTQPPEHSCVMLQQWNDLLFLHWEADAEHIQNLLPPGLTVDTFEGKCYIGLVPFRIADIRPNRCSAVPGSYGFLEINVRTYVHRNGRDPGVWFFSLDAANALACLGARAVYHLPYFFAEMTQDDHWESHKRTTDYVSRRYFPGPVPAYAHVRYTVTDLPTAAAQPGTLDHFLVERYLLYSYRQDNLFVGQVHHSPYLVQSATLELLDENLIALAGLIRPKIPPIIHFAHGVAVNVYGLRKL